MKFRPLAFVFFTSVSPMLGASVTDRVDRLESQVSELQLLLNQINQRGSNHRHSQPRNTSGSGSYVVRSGDSFWTIARRHNISLSSLESANPGISPRRLGVGKTLKIPGGSRTASRQPQTSGSRTGTGTGTGTSSYRVKEGDILGRISENHGIRLHQLMSANPGLDPRKLRVGKVLNIPGQASTPNRTPTLAPAPRKVKRFKTPAPVAKAPQPTSQGVETRRNPYLARTESTAPAPTRNFYEMTPPEPRLVPVSRDSRLVEIAKLHRTTVAQINQLNDVELSPEQMIRSGSQLYVPGR